MTMPVMNAMKRAAYFLTALFCILVTGCSQNLSKHSSGIRYYQALATSKTPVREEIYKGKQTYWRKVYYSADGQEEILLQVTEDAMASAATSDPELALRAEVYQAAYKKGVTSGSVKGEINTAQGARHPDHPQAPRIPKEFTGYENCWQDGWHWGYVWGYNATANQKGPRDP